MDGRVGAPRAGRPMETDDARVAMFREHPPGWWAWPWRLPRPLSVTELIAAGSLSAELAGLLWVALERRTSILVAAGPNGAGKTVTLTALLDFLPPTVARVHLDGMAEDFAFVDGAEPSSTYLLCNEISDHLPLYLWGRRVRRLFDLLPLGFAVGATLHAETVEETLDFLRDPPLSIPDSLLARVPLVTTLIVRQTRDEVVRRLAALHLVEERAGRLVHVPLATWDQSADRHRVFLDERGAALAAHLGLAPDALRTATTARTAWLAERVARREIEPGVFRAALSAYREPHTA
jgi:hypothetical protein